MSGAHSPDLASRDTYAQMSTSVMISRKDNVPLSLFYDYWGDVHGVLAARGEGVANYWQHRFANAIPSFFKMLEDVVQSAPVGDPIVGLAEISFETAEGREALIRSAVAGQMVMDEQNVLKATYMYSSAPGNALTLLDRSHSNAPQGAPEGYSVMTFIRRLANAPTAQFRTFVQEQLCDVLKTTAGVTKVRMHLLEPYDSAAWPTPNVDHERTDVQQYHAYLELAFENEAESASAAFANALLPLAGGFRKYVAAMTTYPVFQQNTMRYEGRPTFAGLRGLSAQRTLTAIGDPANEKELPMLRLIFGDAVLRPSL
jgi:hypothetical protein